MKYLRDPNIYIYLILYIIYFIVLYFYFVNIQTLTIYGDDLSLYHEQNGYTHIGDIIAAGKNVFKFRPVFGVVSYVEVHLFKESLFYYYLFNVSMQTIIAVVFTAIINIFLRSLLLSSFISLLLGLSRFAYYNITQLMCGGPLESLAMILFLITLYYIVVYLTDKGEKSQFNYLIFIIISANLAIYTHERYLILFPVIIIITLLHPIQNRLNIMQKLTICLLSATSIFLNYCLKEYVYHYPFLLGTGTTSLVHDFNFKKQYGFLLDGLASIIQINSGPEYMIGIVFCNTTFFHKVLIFLAITSFCGLIFWYIASTININFRKVRNLNNKLKLISILIFIFFASLAPAVSTVVLEPRWLQAPLSIFILITIVIFANVDTKYNKRKTYLLLLMVLTFLASDYIYMSRIREHFWMKESEWEASCYKDAILRGIISKEINTIYYVEERRDPIREIQINWVLCDGIFFDFYQGKKKGIGFLDTTKFKDPSQLNCLINFDRKTEQIIMIKNGLMVVTDDILKERDKYFKEHGIIAKNN